MATESTSRTGRVVRQFVIDNFLLGSTDTDFSDTDSFVGSGIIDSTGIMELVMFIEETFDVSLDDSELIPENLDSVANVESFVDRKHSDAAIAS